LPFGAQICTLQEFQLFPAVEKPPEKYEKSATKLLPAVIITARNTAVGKTFRRWKTAGKIIYRRF